jgi:hypothetical protein
VPVQARPGVAVRAGVSAASNGEEECMKPDRFKTIASIMIAVVTVIGAALACRASNTTNAATNADFEGLVASIKAEEATILNSITVYEHYQAYTLYTRYNELGNIVADEPPSNELGRLQREVWGLALGLQYTFFPPRYLNPDGTYDVQRELDEEWAERSQQDDLLSEPHFAKADGLRLQASLLAGVLIVFAVAFWFFTLAQAIRNRLKYFFGLAGLAVTVFGLLAWLIVEAAL